MNANQQCISHHKHVVSLHNNILNCLEKEIQVNPMIDEIKLLQIVEGMVADRINIIQIVGKRSNTKEEIIKEMMFICSKIKFDIRNRFKKKKIKQPTAKS